MTFRELIDDAVTRRKTTYRELWRGLGLNPATYGWRLSHDVLTLEEFNKIMGYLEYEAEIKVKDLRGDVEVLGVSKSPRIRQKIKGEALDSGCMEFICRTPEINGTWVELLRIPTEQRYFTAFYLATDEVHGLQLVEVDEMYARDFRANCGVR
ncbi:MAG: hypothetical protein LUD72_13865 [Bacteroidales bacterium]|nr:hypothetical protein [Bacteroidales bacterium]